jgi:hypothetical protein
MLFALLKQVKPSEGQLATKGFFQACHDVYRLGLLGHRDPLADDAGAPLLDPAGLVLVS